MHPLLQTISATIAQHDLLKPHEHVFVALSGGADSVSLLLALQELGYDVEALHCNFHLRGEESDRDELFVRSLCTTRHIPLYVQHFDTRAYANINKVSIEMAARQLRYDWFTQMMTQHNVPNICVAHHQQDQAETLLLNLLRGTGLRGLAAMPYKHPTSTTQHPTSTTQHPTSTTPSLLCDASHSPSSTTQHPTPTTHILRPLLDATRSDIESYLNSLQQPWVIDSTNLERDALRNRIRLDVIPYLLDVNTQVISNITRTASIIQQTLPYLEDVLPTVDSSSTNDQPIKAHNLTELYEAVRPCGFTRQQLTDILSAQTGSVIISATHRLLKDRSSFILRNNHHTPAIPELHYDTFPSTQCLRFEPRSAYFDADTIHQPLTIRPVQPGDRMQPFGMKGTRLLSDIMTDLKLTRFEKEDQHVLIDAAGHILWLIGRRASNLCKITETTKLILKITL